MAVGYVSAAVWCRFCARSVSTEHKYDTDACDSTGDRLDEGNQTLAEIPIGDGLRPASEALQ